MRGLVVFLMMLAVIASFSLAPMNIGNTKNEGLEAEEKTKEFEFSTFTSAVCENSGDFVHCRDEVFVNCNGKVSKAIDVAECDSIRLDAQKATGFAVFGKDWKDPRN